MFQCNEAIENCVGKRSGRPLRDHFKIIRKLAWKKAFEMQRPFEPKSKHKKKKKKISKTETTAKKHIREPAAPKRSKKSVKSSRSNKNLPADGETAAVAIIEEDDPENDIRSSLYTHDTEEDAVPPGKPFPYKPLQNYTSNIKNYMAEKYLDSLYLDKIFLENLKDAHGIKSPNKAGTKKILQMSKSGYKTLSYKQVFSYASTEEIILYIMLFLTFVFILYYVIDSKIQFQYSQ